MADPILNNTGNAVPSTDYRDLQDNMQVLDAVVSGTDETVIDRTGTSRRTLAGIDALAQSRIAAIGYDLSLGDYGAGKTITDRGQVVLRDGEYYKAAASVSLPLVLTGTWATDSSGLVGVGDGVLRQELVANANDFGLLPEIGSYSALRAYAGDVTAYYVRGVANVFDGGYGVFRVDAADTMTADNGGTVLVDATGRRWKRECGVDLHVDWFDGSSNSDKIQSAINALNGGGELTFKRGYLYEIDSGIDIPQRDASASSFFQFGANQAYRTINLNGAQIRQLTDNTPIFNLYSNTANVIFKNGAFGYLNQQSSSDTNAIVFRTNYDSGAAGDGIWDCQFINIFLDKCYRGFSPKAGEENATNPVWGCRFENWCGFNSKKAYIYLSAASGQVRNNIKNVLFYGAQLTESAILFSNVTASSVSDFELLECPAVSFPIIQATGGRGVEFVRCRSEYNTFTSSSGCLFGLFGTAASYIVRQAEFWNSAINLSGTGSLIRTDNSNVVVEGIDANGGTGITITAGNFRLMHVSGSGKIRYTGPMHFSNVAASITSSDQFNVDIDPARKTAVMFTHVVNSGDPSGLKTMDEAFVTPNDCYITKMQFTADKATGAGTVYPRVYADGAQVAEMSAAALGEIKRFGFLSGAILIPAGQRITVGNINTIVGDQPIHLTVVLEFAEI